MAVTWKQLDTNKNGYLDSNEVTAAKAKGCKNVWYSMTEKEFNAGTTSRERVSNLQDYLNTINPITRTALNFMSFDDDVLQDCNDDLINNRELAMVAKDNSLRKHDADLFRHREMSLQNKLYAQLLVVNDKLEQKKKAFDEKYNTLDWVKSFFVDNKEYERDKKEIEQLELSHKKIEQALYDTTIVNTYTKQRPIPIKILHTYNYNIDI